MALSRIPPAGHAQYVGARNLIINGAMQINERGNLPGVTSSIYGPNDRFKFTVGNAGTWSISQSTIAPTGFTSSYLVDCTTADASLASSDYCFLEQRIEAQNLQHLSYGTSDAKKITLSFYVRSNKTGTYAIEFQHGDAGSNYWNNNTYSISAANTWEQKTITISGQTATAINNDNGIGLYVRWWLVSGTQYSSGTVTNDSWHQTDANRAAGQVNLADSTSNEFYLTGVQLEVGDKATDFEHRSYADELQRCKRYFQKVEPNTIYSSYGATWNYATWTFSPEMRAQPALAGTMGGTLDGLNTRFAQRYIGGNNYAYFKGSSTRTTADAEL